MRSKRISTSCTVLFSPCPMCSTAVTFGGGITIGEELLPTNRVHIEDNSIIAVATQEGRIEFAIPYAAPVTVQMLREGWEPVINTVQVLSDVGSEQAAAASSTAVPTTISIIRGRASAPRIHGCSSNGSRHLKVAPSHSRPSTSPVRGSSQRACHWTGARPLRSGPSAVQ